LAENLPVEDDADDGGDSDHSDFENEDTKKGHFTQPRYGCDDEKPMCGLTESMDGVHFGSVAPDTCGDLGSIIDFEVSDAFCSMDTTGYAAMNKHIGADEPLELAFTGYTRYFLGESIDKWREHPSLSDELADPNNIITVRMNHVTH